MIVHIKVLIFGYVYLVWKYLEEFQHVNMHYFIFKKLIDIIHLLWILKILEYGALNVNVL